MTQKLCLSALIHTARPALVGYLAFVSSLTGDGDTIMHAWCMDHMQLVETFERLVPTLDIVY